VSSRTLPGGLGELLWDRVKFEAKRFRQSSKRGTCTKIFDWEGNELKMDTKAYFGIHEDRCLIGCVSTQYLTATVMQAKGLDDCFPSLCGHWHVASLLTRDKSELIKHMPQPWDDFDQQFACGGKLWRCTRYGYRTKCICSQLITLVVQPSTIPLSRRCHMHEREGQKRPSMP
jgi:hypothetical protein